MAFNEQKCYFDTRIKTNLPTVTGVNPHPPPVGRFAHRRTRWGAGGGGGGLYPPLEFFKRPFSGKKTQHVIFGQNHLIFGQPMEKIFGQLTSAPLNENGPVRLWLCYLDLAPVDKSWPPSLA